MSTQSQKSVTEMLRAWSQGEPGAADELFPLVYAELRKRAAGAMRRERSGHTLQPTALVHEAYLRLADQKDVTWQNRGQFFGLAAQAMRRILVDHARKRRAHKRQGGLVRVSFDEGLALPVEAKLDLLVLDEALDELAALHPEQAKVVELRYFGGMSFEETALSLGISVRTAKRHWAVAKAWLHSRLEETKEAAPQ